MYALLLVLLIAESPTFTVVPGFVVIKAPVARPTPRPPARAAPVVRPAGYHEHRCAVCGTVWGHGSASYGNRAAHTCPKCGHVQWQRADGTSDEPMKFTLPRTATKCPT